MKKIYRSSELSIIAILKASFFVRFNSHHFFTLPPLKSLCGGEDAGIEPRTVATFAWTVRCERWQI
jgi:hypothetical protein